MKILCIFAVLALTGCSTAEYRGAIAAGAAESADATLEAAVWVMCKASPAGAVMRRFGTSVELWNAFITVCWREPLAAADKPPLPPAP